jgi:hypothetical protein
VIDLIGKPYRLGADGTDPDGALDCIHLVYTVLGRLGIATPEFDPSWYDNNKTKILRALLRWGDRVDQPQYDGDVLLLPQTTATFAVSWSQGCLYINQHLKAVAWSPFPVHPSCRCFRMKNI